MASDRPRKRRKLKKEYGIDDDNIELHHLIPKNIIKFNAPTELIPLKPDFHHKLHQNYSNIELALDPIKPICDLILSEAK
jgi:predicted HNH restriction endonuclease